VARGKSAYNRFIAKRLKGVPSRELPAAMRAAAADWRGGRRNPGGMSTGTLLLLGVGGYFGYQYLRRHGGLGMGASTIAAPRAGQ
jgi:hypothetical protein